jgi:chromosome segregation ATPase
VLHTQKSNTHTHTQKTDHSTKKLKIMDRFEPMNLSSASAAGAGIGGGGRVHQGQGIGHGQGQGGPHYQSQQPQHAGAADTPYSRSTPSSSSSSSHQYAALIQTITELRTDLERTVGKIKYLEKENNKIQNNYVKVKDELVDTRKKYNEARENYHRAVAEKFDAEKLNEEFMERVKVQLTDKTREFEALRDKFAPQDIDFIRIKLQEELEIPHKHRIQGMENEVEAVRQQYFSIKRELDRCRAEFDAYSNNQKIEATSIINEKEEIIAALRGELDKYKSRENSLEKDDIIRSQRLKLQECHQVADSLREEVRNVSKDRDSVTLLLAETKSKAEELLGKYRGRVATAESEKLALEQRVSMLTLEIDRKEAANHILRDKLEEIVGQREATDNRLGDAESRIIELKAELAESQLSSKIQHSKDMQDMQAEMERLTSRLADREELLRRAQRELTDMQTKFEVISGEQRRSSTQQTQELSARIQSLTKELEESQRLQNAKEFKQHQAYETLSVELESVRAELLPLRKEKDLLHTRILDLENSLEAERKQIAQSRRDASSATYNLQQNLNEANEKLRNVESQLSRLRQSEAEKAKEVDVLKAQLERAATESSRLIAQSQREAREKVSGVEAKYLQKADEIKHNFNSLLLKEKKKSQAYKEKALDAHRREKLISETALAAAMYGPNDALGGIYPSMQEVFGEHWTPAMISQLAAANIDPARSAAVPSSSAV